MDTQKSRAYLKSLFRAGSIPSDADFGKLIDSVPNLVDDKVERRKDGSTGSALCVGAGENGVLMSFFASLDQAGSNWSLQLSNTGGLDFKAKNRTTSVLSLDPSGRVGIGTSSPQSTLDVRGHVQAASLASTGDLKVGGKATVGALEIAGLGVPVDAQLMQQLITQLQSGNTGPRPRPSLAPPVSFRMQFPTNNQPAEIPQDFSGSDVQAAPSNDTTVVYQPVAGGDTGTPWVEHRIPASRDWKDVAGPFVGMKVLVIVAWVIGVENKSVCYTTAVNMDGDHYSGAIQTTYSYQGRARGRIHFQWVGGASGYSLQCRTGLRYETGVNVVIRIQELL